MSKLSKEAELNPTLKAAVEKIYMAEGLISSEHKEKISEYGAHRHPRLGITHTYTVQIMKFEASNGTLSLSNNTLTYKNLLVPSKL